MKTALFFCLFLTGCSSTPLESKRSDIIKCFKDLKGYEVSSPDAFEVCRQVYGLSKVKDY